MSLSITRRRAESRKARGARIARSRRDRRVESTLRAIATITQLAG
jgi:hypothetical protein